MRMASFLNRAFYKKQAMRISTYDIPRVISLYKEDEERIYLPRGCSELLFEMLDGIGVTYHIQDLKNEGVPLQVAFRETLKEKQQVALDELIKYDFGILVAPTAFEKTVVAAALITHHKVNTIILVNNVNLCIQWRESLKKFLDAPDEFEIGEIHATKKRITGQIDVALVQSLNSNEELKSIRNHYGMVICDEVHQV